MSSQEIKKAGNMRVKQKVDRKPMSDHTLINRFVRDINERVERMNDLKYAKFRDYTHQLIKNYVGKQNRKHFIHRKDYALFRDGQDKFIYSEMFYAGEKFRLYLKPDLESWAKKAYNNYGLDNLNKLLFMIAASLEKESYVTTDPGSFYNEERFKSACDVLGVDMEKKVLFSVVRRVYEEKLKELKEKAGEIGEMEMEEERSKINEAFMLIRKQYSNYLEELTPKLPEEILIPSDKLIIDENDNVEIIEGSDSEEEEELNIQNTNRLRKIPDHLLEIPDEILNRKN